MPNNLENESLLFRLSPKRALIACANAMLHAEDFCRSVVLFNTWPDIDAPPSGVDLEPPSSVTRISGSLGKGSSDSESGCSAGDKLVVAESKDDWRSAPVQSARECDAPSVKMKVWLLGDETRRGQLSRTRPYETPATIDEALLEETVVTHIP